MSQLRSGPVVNLPHLQLFVFIHVYSWPSVFFGFPTPQNYDILWVKGWTGMAILPTNEYLEPRNGGYYVAGTRVGLDIVAHDFREGKSPEAILQAYPSIGSLARVYGAIAFLLEHRDAVESYLCEQDALWKEFRDKHPLPDEMLDSFRQAQNTRV